MPLPVDREGAFRANITGYGLKEMQSGSVSIAIRCQLTALFNGAENEWEPWDQYDMEAEGDVWVIKKDGTVNEGAASSLMRCAGWDGNLESIVAETWHPTPCQVIVKREEYNGAARYKVAFVNDFNRQPGGLSNIDAAKAKELQARFGSPLRAIAGNLKRNGAPPASRPAPPPVATGVMNPPPPNGQDDEAIPF